MTTVELDEKKVALARENISRAGAAGWVRTVNGDALDYATRFDEIAFCFSDLQPLEHNAKVYEKVVPHLVPGGLLVIDNVTSPRLQTELLDRAEMISEWIACSCHFQKVISSAGEFDAS